MIARFSLYGFLKNQRYFEAFIVLAFLEKGLDFFQIGLLVAVRELTVNALEIPSGALADVRGRRACMIAAFAAYVASFVVLAFAAALPPLLLAMVLYGVGEAFRSGTHKAMIFAWLRRHGREAERVRVYGYTRSWSKIGSAVSVVIAAVIVLALDGFTAVFLASAVPYALNVVNLLSYPRWLDRPEGSGPCPGLVRHVTGALRGAVRRPRLRRLFLEAMGFDGVFAATKDYLQPVLAAAALGLAGLGFAEGWSGTQLTAVLVAPVYLVLHLLSGAASRLAHRVADAAGGEDAAARRLWWADAGVFAVLLAAAAAGSTAGMIAGFVALHVAHNVWRPILIARFDVHGDGREGATLLSIESQARRLATVLVAPALGLAVDATLARAPGPAGYWPVAAVGLAVATAALVLGRGGEPPRGLHRVDHGAIDPDG